MCKFCYKPIIIYIIIVIIITIIIILSWLVKADVEGNASSSVHVNFKFNI